MYVDCDDKQWKIATYLDYSQFPPPGQKNKIFNKVDKLASEWGVSKSYVVRFIVYDYFESEE